MKRLFLILAIVPLLCSAQILSKQITISLHQKTISESIELISVKATFDYSYNANLIDDDTEVSGTFTGTVKEVLEEVLKDRKIDFKEVNGQILFYKRKEKKVVKTVNTIFGQVRDLRGDALDDVQVYDDEGLIDIRSGEVGRFEFTIPNPSYSVFLNFYKAGYFIKRLKIKAQTDQEVVVVLEPREQVQGIDLEIEKPEPNAAFSDTAESWYVPRFFVSDKVLNAQDNTDTLHYKFASAGLFPPASSKYLRAGYEVNSLSFHALADYGAEIKGFSFTGLAGIYRFNTNGLIISGLGNWTGGSMRGLQVGGLMNNNVLRTDGIQIAGVLNVAGVRQTGLQISGITNVNRYRAYGVQISGLYNFTRIMHAGIQLSAVLNQSGNTKGIQLGLINSTKRLDGVQIGLINYARSARYGAQIGLINIVKFGYRQLQFSYDDMQFVDFSFRSGSQHFYSSLHAAAAFTYDSALYRLGYGLGTEWNIVGPLAVNLEGVVYHVTEQPFTQQISALGVGKLGLSLNVLGLSFFGSINYNAYYTNYLNQDGTGPQIPIIQNPEEQTFEGDYVLQQSRGYSFGLRIFL